MSNSEIKSITRELQAHAAILGGFAALLWAIEIVDVFVFRGRLNAYGIRPRSLQGLEGILLMPFLHGNFAHLAANTLPFLTLGWLIMLREISDFFIVSAVTILVSGVGVWLTGAPNSIHIGASGLVLATSVFCYCGAILNAVLQLFLCL
jgi:membrane associated rhomboid family serine protease